MIFEKVNTSTAFDDLLGGYKTYITAGIGVVYNLVTAFGLWNPTEQQNVAVNGVIFALAALFIRLGVKKAQHAAVQAASNTAPSTAEGVTLGK